MAEMRAMKILYILTIALLATGSASSFAQQQIMRSSNPQGIQIQGNTNIAAENKNAAAVSMGDDNLSRNVAGSVRGGTQIQGNTNITARQTNAVSVTVGKGNTAANEAGVIGGK